MDGLPAPEGDDKTIGEETSQAPSRSEAVSPKHEDPEARRIEEAFHERPKEGLEEEVPPEKETTVVPPEKRGPEGLEKPPPEGTLKDSPKEAEETGAQAAEGLPIPSSTEVQAQSKIDQSQEEVSEAADTPSGSKAVVLAKQRKLDREPILKKAA